MDRVTKLTQAYSQAPWRKQMQALGLFLLILVLVAVVAGIYLNVTARAATIGREILGMQKQIEALKLDNANLETRLAMITSATEMEKRARALGFKPLEQAEITYLVVDGYIPRQQAVIAPPPEPVVVVPASLPPVYSESLFDWLREDVIPAVSRALEVEQ
jgi:cell division protein FtsL